MKVIGIEHIGIAVEDLEKSASFWKNIICLKHCGTEDVDEQGVLTDIYDTGSGKIELLVSKYPNSPISKFIKKRGTGIHHICLNVEDIDVSALVTPTLGFDYFSDLGTYSSTAYNILHVEAWDGTSWTETTDMSV